MYLVGGAVRDILDNMPRTPSDLDFAVEAASYDIMKANLVADGLELWAEHPEYVTLRGGMPVGKFGGTFRNAVSVTDPNLTISADFVLCRRDGVYTDQRHPDTVEPGTLYEDLARRDFTINAMAMTPDGELIDPHMGLYDLRHGILRTVGDPNDRLREDPLRIVRALRFAVTRNLSVNYSLDAAIIKHAPLLRALPAERVARELNSMFQYDTRLSIHMLAEYPAVTDVLFHDAHKREPGNLWLQPTLKQKG